MKIIPRSHARETVRIHGVPRGSQPQRADSMAPVPPSAESSEAETSTAPSTLVADLSHELKTPLSAIIGFIEVLLSDDLTEEHRETLSQVKDSADGMMSLIGGILDYHRITSDKLQLNETYFDLENLIFQAVELTRARVCGNGIELLCDIDMIPGHILGDRLRIRQILLNLLTNALKFTYEGEIVIQATLREIDSDESELIITVRDTGIGFSAERANHIFDPLVPVDGSISGIQGGTGLGLTISRELAELMGGCLTAQSVPGAGSAFALHLFVKTPLDEEPKVPSDLVESSEQLPRTVLVVDDNPTSINVLLKYLTTAGVSTFFANDVKTAKKLISNHQFDLILYDFGLEMAHPDLLAQEVSQLSPENRPNIIPLISEPKQRVALRREPHLYATYLLKPIRRKELLRKISVANESKRRDITPLPSLRWSQRPDEQLKILLVEDDPPTRAAMAHAIDRLGHVADEAATADEAAGVALSHPYDLIFFDVHTPGTDGPKIVRFLRSRGISAPIVAITAGDNAEMKQRFVDAGVSDYMYKPLTITVISEILERHMPVAQNGVLHNDLRVMILTRDGETLSLMGETILEKIPTAQIRTPSQVLGACVEIGSFLPHLLIVDTDLTEIDVAGLVSYLRDGPRYASMQILLTTTSESSSDVLDSNSINGVLGKPFGRQTFTDMLGILLGETPAPQAPSPSSPAPSLRALAQMMELDTQQCQRLIGQVIETAEQRLGRIEHALRHQDMATTQKEAHALRGSALSFRLEKMGAVATRIEEGARTFNINIVTANVSMLKTSLEELRSMVNPASP